jgi:hypothetical protein
MAHQLWSQDRMSVEEMMAHPSSRYFPACTRPSIQLGAEWELRLVNLR